MFPPRLVRDETVGVFRIERADEQSAEPLQFACKRITLALESALATGGANGLSEVSYEAFLIRGAITSHHDDGSLLAVAFYDACMGLQKNIGDIYPEDTALVNLKNALYAVVEELSEQDPTIKSRVVQLVALGSPHHLTKEDRADALEVPEKVRDQVDNEAFAEI